MTLVGGCVVTAENVWFVGHAGGIAEAVLELTLAGNAVGMVHHARAVTACLTQEGRWMAAVYVGATVRRAEDATE